jgi:hypothetical protein
MIYIILCRRVNGKAARRPPLKTAGFVVMLLLEGMLGVRRQSVRLALQCLRAARPQQYIGGEALYYELGPPNLHAVQLTDKQTELVRDMTIDRIPGRIGCV